MGKFVWGVKAKHCWVLSTNFWEQKVCGHYPSMFCLITSSNHSCQKFGFSFRMRRMRSNLSYLLKSFLLYQQNFWLFWCEYLRFQVKNMYSLAWNTELKLPELLDFPFGNSTQSHSSACIFVKKEISIAKRRNAHFVATICKIENHCIVYIVYCIETNICCKITVCPWVFLLIKKVHVRGWGTF